jgi:two-component sensor histidine kinase
MTKAEPENLQVALQTIRKHLSRIHHDLNNPLSIVSGNLQLIQELSAALDVEEHFEGPVKDIAAALEQLSDSTEQLIVVRNILQQLDES